VKQNGSMLQYVEKQTMKICLESIKDDDSGDCYNFLHVKEQNDNLCLKAATYNGNAMRFIKYQSEDICIAGVQNCGSSLMYVRNQTEQICVCAVKNDKEALEYVDEKYKKQCIKLLTHNC